MNSPSYPRKRTYITYMFLSIPSLCLPFRHSHYLKFCVYCVLKFLLFNLLHIHVCLNMYSVFKLHKKGCHVVHSFFNIYIFLNRKVSDLFSDHLLQVVCLIFSREMEMGFDFSFSLLGLYLLGGLSTL